MRGRAAGRSQARSLGSAALPCQVAAAKGMQWLQQGSAPPRAQRVCANVYLNGRRNSFGTSGSVKLCHCHGLVSRREAHFLKETCGVGATLLPASWPGCSFDLCRKWAAVAGRDGFLPDQPTGREGWQAAAPGRRHALPVPRPGQTALQRCWSAAKQPWQGASSGHCGSGSTPGAPVAG
jgi:hypothetical protein